MKKYIVLRKIGMFNADSVREFDKVEDAKAFKELLQSSETHSNTVYFVAQVL